MRQILQILVAALSLSAATGGWSSLAGEAGRAGGSEPAKGVQDPLDLDVLFKGNVRRDEETFSKGLAPTIEVPIVGDQPEDLPQVPPRLRLEESWQRGPNCGPVAVFFLLHLLGWSHVSLDDVLASSPVSDQGCSLADLEEVIHKHADLDTAVLKVSPSEWESLPTPFIIHLDTADRPRNAVGHFDVVARVHPEGTVDVIDTQNSVTKQVTYGVLVPEFSGYVLVAYPRFGMGVRILWFTFWAAVAANVVLAAIVLGRKVTGRHSPGSSRTDSQGPR